MNILLISHFVPYPLTSGALQRNYNLLREISKQHTVYMVTLTQKALLSTINALQNAQDHVAPFCKTIAVFEIPSDKSKVGLGILLLLNLIKSTPYSVDRFYSKKMKVEIESVLKEKTIDVIHIDTIDLMQYVPKENKVPVVLNHHNIESALLTRRAKNAKNPFTKLYAYVQAFKLKSYEKKMMPQAKVNIAVSDIDIQGFKKICPNANYQVVENGTDTEYFTPLGSWKEPILIFAGGLNWYPNKDGMLYFCTKILPIIAKAIPNVLLQIIGQDPPKEFTQLAAQGLPIKVIGFVPDIRDYFANAAIQVVPLRVGGGTRLKILDALAMGKAVVSTSVGAEGLKLTPGKDLLIADTIEIFAQVVIELLGNMDKRIQLGAHGRATIESEYSWHVIGPKLTGIYDIARRYT